MPAFVTKKASEPAEAASEAEEAEQETAVGD